VATLTEKLIAMWGNGAEWKNAGGDHLHEATFLKLDSSKAQFQVGLALAPLL
jgi:CDP-glucose 4,6-dehydratase